MTVKIRTVHTGKLCLAAHGQTTSAAHTSTVDHNRVHADHGLNSIFFRRKAYKFHHDQRSNSDHFIVFISCIDQFFKGIGNKSFFPITSIICHHHKLIACILKLFLKDHQILISKPYDRMDFCTHFMQLFCHRISNGTTDTTSNHSNLFQSLCMSRNPERSHKIVNISPSFQSI